jgi:hypothetical protein
MEITVLNIKAMCLLFFLFYSIIIKYLEFSFSFLRMEHFYIVLVYQLCKMMLF